MCRRLLYSSEPSNLFSFDPVLYFYSSFMDTYYKPGFPGIPRIIENNNQVKPKKVLFGHSLIYILTEQGTVYYGDASKFSSLELFKVITEIKILDILWDDLQFLCQTDQGVYLHQINIPLIKAKYINFFDFYLCEYQSTISTIHINQDGFLITNDYDHDTNQSDQCLVKTPHYIYTHLGANYRSQFKEVKHLGSGSFGKVLLVNKLDNPNKHYAIKKIWLDVASEFNFEI